MKKIFAFTYLFIICFVAGFPQAVQDEGRFIPASPTVAELSKYGKIPVGHYTGTPNISIPLYTLQCGQLSLPISLTYHAGGIRVDQIASWVGLGWSLNAGGIINATTMGLSDLKFNTRLPMKTFENFYTSFYSRTELINVVNGQLDSQPDIYSYSFLNHSGQFIQSESGSFFDIRNNLEIQIARVSTNLFEITDSYGTVYEFRMVEQTTRHSYRGTYNFRYDMLSMSHAGSEEVYTGWFLTSVTSADGLDKITFNYEQEIQKYDTPLNGKLLYDFLDRAWAGSAEGAYRLNAGEPFNRSEIENRTYRLTSVEARSNNKLICSISFTGSEAERKDLEGSHRLEKISLLDAYYNPVKEWEFKYDYLHPTPLREHTAMPG